MGGWAPLGTGLCQAGGMDQQLCKGWESITTGARPVPRVPQLQPKHGGAGQPWKSGSLQSALGHEGGNHWDAPWIPELFPPPSPPVAE